MINYLIGAFLITLIASMIAVRQVSLMIVDFGGIEGGLAAIVLIFAAGFVAAPYLD